LQELLVNVQMQDEAAAGGALPHGEMPGGLPGDNFVHLNFGGEDDAEGEDPTTGRAREGAPAGDEALPVFVENEEDEDEEEVEEVGILLAVIAVVLLNSVRSHRYLFVCCVIWSAVFGVVSMPKTRAHLRTNHRERQIWMA
jgi:hypothetical protein